MEAFRPPSPGAARMMSFFLGSGPWDRLSRVSVRQLESLWTRFGIWEGVYASGLLEAVRTNALYRAEGERWGARAQWVRGEGIEWGAASPRTAVLRFGDQDRSKTRSAA